MGILKHFHLRPRQGDMVRCRLLPVLFAMLCAAGAANAATRQAISPAGVFFDISGRFEKKPIACQLMRNGSFQAGFVTTERRKRYWNSISALIKQRRSQRRPVTQISREHQKLNRSCEQRARTVCKPKMNAQSVAVLESTPLLFTPTVTNRCRLALQLSIIDSPERGILAVEGGGYSYTPNSHSMVTDTAQVQVSNSKGSSGSQTLTFTFQQRAAQFAGDKNSLQPYRDTLTKAEVDSLLGRVGMGGNPQLREMRSLSAIVDALLDNTESPATAQYLRNFEASRIGRLNASGDTTIRWFSWDLPAINMQALRYGAPLRTWMGYNFWMNHFATDIYQQSNGGNSEAMIDHIMFLRNYGTRSFETLLKGMTSKLLLNTFLNSFDNTNAAPNENFPREMLELFTAGVVDPISGEQNYTEADVESVTKIFAGMYWQGAGLGYRPIPGNAPLATPRILEASDDDSPVFSTQVVDPVTARYCERKTPNRIQIRWPIYQGWGSHVRIFRAPLGSTTFAQIAEVPVWDAEFHDHVAYTAGQVPNTTINCPRPHVGAAPVPGQVYQYKIQFIRRHDTTGAVVNQGLESGIETGYFAGGAGTPAIPANQAASNNLSDRIRISWSASQGATSYRIVRAAYDRNWEDTIIAEVPAGTLSYDDFSVLPNEHYMYYVRAINGSNRLLSPHPVRLVVYQPTTFVNGIAPQPDPPNLRSVQFVRASTNNQGSITVDWDPVPGAAGYRVFQFHVWRELFIRAVNVYGATTYVDSTTAPGEQIWYTVVPFDAAGQLAVDPGGAAQRDDRYLERVVVRNAQNQVIADDLKVPRIFFLDWMPDNHPNVGGRILGPNGNGDSYSVFGQIVTERIAWEPVRQQTKSFLDHLLYNWPATSRNIAAKLFASTVHREINEQLVNQIARKLVAERYDLNSTLRMLLMSSASFSPEANGTCIMNPTEALTTFLRRSDLPVTRQQTLNKMYSALESAGHETAKPPSVFGFRNCGVVRSGVVNTGSDWLTSAQPYVSLGNGFSDLIKQMTDPRSTNGEEINLLVHFVPSTGILTAQDVVDRIADKLGITVSPAQRDTLVDYLNRRADGQLVPWRQSLSTAEHNSRLSGLIRLMVMSPAFLSK